MVKEVDAMKFVEKTGITVAEATGLALKALNKTQEQVEIDILDEGSKGFLGFGKRPAKVRVTAKYDPIEETTNYLKALTLGMNIVANIEITPTSKGLQVELSGENMGVLIGKRGHTLEAIQTLTNMSINKGEHPYLNIEIDVEDYKRKRKENLENLAFNLARKVRNTGESVTLEPMSVADRRIIHFALDKERGVKTKSAGQEPYRYVIIVPKGK